MSQLLTITQQDILQQVKLSSKFPEIIEGIISCKVITDTAAEAGIKVTPDELQNAADEFRMTNQLHNAQETWQWLSKNGLSLDDFEQIIHRGLLAVKLVQHLFQDKIESYFIEHRLEYTGVVMYEIYLDNEDLAMELYLEIQNKESSFFEVAHQYIQDSELRRKGGYQGILYRKDIKPEISSAVFAANPPQLLKPIVTAQTVYLILVEEIIKPQLTKVLAEQIGLDLFTQWLKEKVQEVEYELVGE
jgi:parvulin-like peptidyl-prolyl isomerase